MDYMYYDTISKGRVYVLVKEYTFYLDGKAYTIPAGFESDGMSCPKWAWHFFSPAKDIRTLECSIIHDWLYASGAVSRWQADAWYRQALERLGYSISAGMAFVALRCFGWRHWKKESRKGE